MPSCRAERAFLEQISSNSRIFLLNLGLSVRRGLRDRRATHQANSPAPSRTETIVDWANFSIRRRMLADAAQAQRTGPRRARVASSRRRLRIEQLEDRRLLSISVNGVPDWVEEGPGPIFAGLVGGDNNEGIVNSPAAGAVTSIAVDPSNANVVS